MEIRMATPLDLIEMQAVNLQSLPENYTLRYYLYHLTTWPQCSFVAVMPNGKIVGYVLGKIDDDEEQPEGQVVSRGKEVLQHGHITSLSVLRSYRRLGCANKLMDQAQHSMKNIFGVRYCSLHVRLTNRAARSLYEQTLGFKIDKIEKGYYADGEDALAMRRDF